MNLVYNNNEIVQNSECYLASPSHDIICKLNSIDESSSEYNKPFMDMKELSFNVYRYINVDGVEIIATGYEELKNSMYLYLTHFGWYKISEVEITNDTTEYKKIVAKSVECELLQYDLLGFKINTGEVDSAEYLADDNIGVDELAKEYVIFYNTENKQLSLLDLMLEKVRGWKIGYVDESLKYKRFTFSIDSTPIYSFMRNELQQQARCIFVFDNENYTINVYAIENFEEDTGIYISMRNLANTINITCDDQNIYTCFNVSGGENLKNINRINFGNSYVEDLSYFMCEPYMSSELIEKYQNWLDYREEKRVDYVYSSEQYAYYYALADEVKNRVPVDDLSNTWKGYTLEELEKYRDFYVATIAAIKAEFGNNESEIKKYPIWHTYIQYIEILGNIQAVIDNYNTSNEITLSDDWETNWDLYGVDELSYKVESYAEQLGIYADYKADFIDSKGNYKNWGMLSTNAKKKYSSESDYNDKLDTYIGLNDKYNECLLFFNARTDEYNNYVSIYEDFANDLKIIANDVLIENSTENFTEDELTVLNRLRNYTDYQNENILILNTYDASQEINAQLDLLNDAKEQLTIASQPQFIFNVDIDNLIAIPEFKEWALQLDVGSFIYLEVRKDYIVKLRVAEISGINPFNMQENNLKLEFSNMIKGMQGVDDYNFLLGTSVNASKNSISYGSSASSGSNNSNGIQLTTNILTMIANSNVFKNKFDTLYSNSIVSNDAKINVILTDNLDAKIAQIDFATILEATINLGFLKTLIAGHATVADLFSKHFIVDSGVDGSIEFNGTTMQFKDKDNNVYIQLGTDEQGGHSLIIKDKDGNIILTGNGITENAITDGLIVSNMLKKKDVGYNGISGEYLDIDTVVTEINEGSTTIKSSQIYFDKDKQSLDTKLGTMITDINNNLTTNYLTKQETPEKIVEILGQTDISGIEGLENSIINKMNVTEKTVESFGIALSENFTANNLLTGTSSSFKDLTINAYYALPYVINVSDVGLKAGDSLVLRIYVNNPEDGLTGLAARISHYDSSGNSFGHAISTQYIKPGDKGYTEIKTTVNEKSVKLLCGLTRRSSGANFTVQIKEAKLEKNTTATNWCLSPTELDSRITQNETSIKGAIGEIVLKVNKDGKVVQVELGTDAEKGSTFKVDADNINLAAKDVIELLTGGTINLTGNQISIQSKSFKVTEQGAVTADDITVRAMTIKEEFKLMQTLAGSEVIGRGYRILQVYGGKANINSAGNTTFDTELGNFLFNKPVTFASKVNLNSGATGSLDGNATTATTATNVQVANDETYTTYLVGTTSYSSGSRELKTRPTARATYTPGTTTTVGIGQIALGNNTASGTSGNGKGQIVLYGDGTYYSLLQPLSGLTGNRTYILPDKSGTVAMTSDITAGMPKNERISFTFANSTGYVDVTLSNSYTSNTVQITPVKANTSSEYLTQFAVYQSNPSTGVIRIYGQASQSGSTCVVNVSYVAA